MSNFLEISSWGAWNEDPGHTVYRDIKRLMPGYVGGIRRGGETRRFLKLPIEDSLRLERPGEYVAAYGGLLRKAVSDCRRACGALLGGVDSTCMSFSARYSA